MPLLRTQPGAQLPADSIADLGQTPAELVMLCSGDSQLSLLAEVARQGNDIYGAPMEFAYDGGKPSALAAFEATGRAYLAFARATQFAPQSASSQTENAVQFQPESAVDRARQEAVRLARATETRTELAEYPERMAPIRELITQLGIAA